MAQDALDFADGLGLDRFSIVGHDWGARIAYFLAAIVPSRVARMVTLSLGWDPGPLNTPPLNQARRFWYQWFMATDRGAAAVKANPVAFARFQWDTWSPPGWFDDATFETTAASFANEDWPASPSTRIAFDGEKPNPTPATTTWSGGSARCTASPCQRCSFTVPTIGVSQQRPQKTKRRTSPRSVQRRLLPDVGHFPTREAPGRTAAWIADFLRADFP